MQEISFQWWQEPHIVRLYIGDISIHDLWRDEVQYLVDALQFKDVLEGYSIPKTATFDDLEQQVYYCGRHPNDPKRVFGPSFAEDGDDCWVISYFSLCFKLTEDEANELVAKWNEFIEATPEVAGEGGSNNEH